MLKVNLMMVAALGGYLTSKQYSLYVDSGFDLLNITSIVDEQIGGAILWFAGSAILLTAMAMTIRRWVLVEAEQAPLRYHGDTGNPYQQPLLAENLSSEQPSKRTPQLVLARARVPTPVGEDDPLGIPRDHLLDSGPQRCFVLPERDAHITRHPAVRIADASEPRQPSHEPGVDSLRLEVLNEVRKNERARRTMEEDDLGHELAGYGQCDDLTVPGKPA
jgi:hypothetical protein